MDAFKNKLSFIGIALLTVAAVLILSAVYERHFLKDRHVLKRTKGISFIAIFSALAALLMLVEFPLLFLAPDFYKLDFSEVAILICGFYLGPVAGVICELLKVLLHLFLHGTTTNYIGDFSNFLIGCTFVLPASMLYCAKKTKKNAILGLILGTLVMTIFGSLFNGLYLLPAYAELFQLPLDSIISKASAINSGIHDVSTFIIFAVAPFNLLKGAVVSVLTVFLYKRVEKMIIRS